MAAADAELDRVEELPEAEAATAEPVAAPAIDVAAVDEASAAADGKQNAKEKKAGKKGKGEKKGAKKAGKGADAGEGADGAGPSVAAHPRAARGVARAKAWGGLAGFVLAGYLSLPTHTVADAGVRALIAGMLCYVAAWGAAVFVWRRLVMLELRARQQQLTGVGSAAEAPPRGGVRGAPRPGGQQR